MRYSYRPRKKLKINANRILAMLAIALVLFLVLYFVFSKTELSPIIFLSELSTSGYMKTAVDAGVVENNGIVTLTTECYQLVANTEAVQAESITNGIAKKIVFRPNTHDLMRDALDNMGIEIVMVKITDLKNTTFYGKLILKQGNRIVSLDSRPSDGIALAVRTGADVYLKEELMKAQGKYIC